MDDKSVVKRATVPHIKTELFQGYQPLVLLHSDGWGWLPVLSLVMGWGLVILAAAYTGARSGVARSSVLYWMALFVIYLPAAVRLSTDEASRLERVGLVVGVGISFLMVKLFYSPLEFQFSDELQHWRSSYDTITRGWLFQYNHSLPIATDYPGLHAVTSAVAYMTGLDTHGAGVVVLIMTRILLVMALFHFFERISDSHRVAGLATLVYMLNPHFMFFTSMFAYQTLALSFAAFTLYITIWSQKTRDQYIPLSILLFVLSAFATVVTHHVTSYATILILAVWTVVGLAMKITLRPTKAPLWRALVMLLMVYLWIRFVAPGTPNYVFGSEEPREEGKELALPSGPAAEQVLNMGTVGMIAAVLPFALWAIKEQYPRSASALSLGFGSLLYYGVIILRLVAKDGAQTAGRSWSFIFLMVSFTLAVGMLVFRQSIFERDLSLIIPRRILRIGLIKKITNTLYRLPGFKTLTGLVYVMLLIMLLGGITGGWPPYWGRLPGPYLVEASERSVEPEGVAAAWWTRYNLGEGNRISSNFTNHYLQGAYGGQDPVFGLADVFTSEKFGAQQINDVRRLQVKYLVVDGRISTALPVRGIYFGPLDDNVYDKPIPIENLRKFDSVQTISRIYDSGNIVIYDMSAYDQVK
jgi:hypothetical protein